MFLLMAWRLLTKMFFSNKQNGSGLIEVVVGLAIIFMSIFAMVRTYNYYLKFALSHKGDVQASLLMEEGIEVVKILRDVSWGSRITPLSAGMSYYLTFDGSSWKSTTTNKYIDGVFSRTFVLDNVYRDASDRIYSAGALDPNTKKVTVSVSYLNLMGTTTESMSSFITNLFNN